MFRRLLPTLALTLGLASAAPAAFTTTFEDAGLAPETAVNNAGPAGGFTFDGNFLNNSYDPTYGSWSGWAISNTTDAVTGDFTNQFSAVTGSGAGGSATYSVAFAGESPGSSYINLAEGATPVSFAITNTTYAAGVIRNGNQFSRPFEAGDFFVVDIQGFDGLAGTGSLLGTINYYLADYRDGMDFILSTWDTVDLSSLAGARSLRFGLRSTDVGPFGINTPTYFAFDDLTFDAAPAAVPEPASLALVASGLLGVLAIGGRRSRAIRGSTR